MLNLTRLVSAKSSMGTALATRAATTAAASTSTSTRPPTGGYKFDNARFGKNIVLVEGVRTPFTMSGTAYNDLWAYELQTKAIT